MPCFEVSDADRDAPGTTITLTLRDADPENGLEDFTQEWVIKQTVKRYSDFVQYPIELAYFIDGFSIGPIPLNSLVVPLYWTNSIEFCLSRPIPLNYLIFTECH